MRAVGRATGLPAMLSRRELRVVTTSDVDQLYANPRAELKRLTDAGLLRRLHTGIYAIVPPEQVGTAWLPSLEAAAGGIATALYGADGAVVMGLSAVRLLGASPRARAQAQVAVPAQRRPIRLLDTRWQVRFVKRDVSRLDAERVSTELGPVLVTSPEQTILDLATPQILERDSLDEREAIEALADRADPGVLEELAATQRLRAALGRARRVVPALGRAT